MQPITRRAPAPRCICVQICAVCNDAQIVFDAEEGTYGRIGEPTEAALSVLVEKLGVPGAFERNSNFMQPSKMHSSVPNRMQSQISQVLAVGACELCGLAGFFLAVRNWFVFQFFVCALLFQVSAGAPTNPSPPVSSAPSGLPSMTS